jgi:electron transport complex protein RnfG
MTGKDIFKITINLVIIYIVGGLLLAGVYAWTSPIIFVTEKEEKERARQKMMPLHLIVNAPSDAEAKIKELLPEAGRTEEGLLDAEVDLYEKGLKKLRKRLKKAGAIEIEEYSDFKTEKTGDWEIHHKHAEYFGVTEGEESTGYLVETYGKGYSSYVHVLVATDRDFVVQKINVIGHGETPGLGDEIEVAEFKNQYRGKDLEHLVVIKGETEDEIQAITGATISTRAVTNGVRDAVEMLIEKYTGEGETEEAKEEEHARAH